jgi:Fe-S oxidoreductase
MLLIEHEGINPDNVVERIVLNQNRLTRVKRLALQTQEVYGEPGLSRCWRARDRAMPRLTRTADNVLPAPFVENTAVPPDRLPDFIAKVQNIMKRHGVTATYSAHAGVGILHARPLLDIHREIDRRRMPEIVEEMFEAVQECGGTFNGEHGVGPLRTGMLRRQYTKLYPAFERIKSIFDPYGVLNPGRIVNATSEFPIDLVRTARIIANDEPLSSTPQLRWPQLGLVETAERCNGCGACQSTNASVRMCPTYRAQSGEQQSPRALANLMRQWSHGELADAALTDPDFKRLVDHCVYCKMCRVECPTSVDISKLMLEAKAAYVAEEGLSRTDWFLANWASWSSWGSGQAHFANRLLAQPSARWLLEKAFGLSRRRRLLRLHHLTFLRRAQQAGWTKKPRPTRRREKYALFVDAYTNFHDPDLGEAVAKILLHHGHLVYVPIRQRPSGINYLQYGDIESARSQMMWNFEIAAELVREGYTLIATEPSAALMLRDEARHLMADTDLDVVANNTFEASEFFAREADLGRLATLPHEIPLAVAYHEPCHQRALDQRALPASLLKRIPGLRLLELELGCSGMAETYGLSARGHDRSLQAGKAMLSRVARGDVLAATTQCGACRLQIEEAAAKPTMHPVKLLAVALGLSDRPMDLFVKPQGRLLAP